MYLKKTCKAGITIEVYKSYSARYGRNIPRGNRESRTPEAMKKYNEKMAWRKLTRQINANFIPGDLFLTCTYQKDERPDPQRAKQNMENFLDRVRRRFKKAGIEFKYILVTAYGKQGGIHHHVIIPAFDYRIVTACWPHGAMRFTALYQEGEYSALAWYLIKQSHLSPTGEESIPGNRWSGIYNYGIICYDISKFSTWNKGGRIMRWLHLSDIHINKNFNQVSSNILRDELAPFLKNEEIKVDYLFVTGDYRDFSILGEDITEDMDEQAKTAAQYILEISKAIGVPSERIYLVPGNHDLDRTVTAKSTLEEINKTYPEKRNLILDNEQMALLEQFCFYDKVDGIIHPEPLYKNDDHSECRSDHHFFPGKEFHILCLNTAMSCVADKDKDSLILGSINVYDKIKESNMNVPVFILAHHGLEYLTDTERKNLNLILKDRRVYYLCGHSHKMAFHFDQDEDLWEIMVGTTKDAKGTYPVFSVGEINAFGELSCLDFYQHQFGNGNGWHFHQGFSCRTNLIKLEFVGQTGRKNEHVNSKTVRLALNQSVIATEDQINLSVKTLAKLKRKCGKNGQQTFLVTSNGLSVNAGILIGYALNKRQSIRLAYEVGDNLFLNNGDRIIPLTDFKDESRLPTEPIKTVNLFVYIQAKTGCNDIYAFNNFVNQSLLENICVVTFIDTVKEMYDQGYNLEKSAAILAGKIHTIWGEYYNRGMKQVNVHLFYNGFWGLALLLGNQLPTTIPISLYDYDMRNVKYQKAFDLLNNLFEGV